MKKLLVLMVFLTSGIAGAAELGEWKTVEISFSHRSTAGGAEIDWRVRRQISVKEAKAILDKRETIENVAAVALARRVEVSKLASR